MVEATPAAHLAKDLHIDLAAAAATAAAPAAVVAVLPATVLAGTARAAVGSAVHPGLGGRGQGGAPGGREVHPHQERRARQEAELQQSGAVECHSVECQQGCRARWRPAAGTGG